MCMGAEVKRSAGGRNTGTVLAAARDWSCTSPGCLPLWVIGSWIASMSQVDLLAQ
jgi:hypothetical protein